MQLSDVEMDTSTIPPSPTSNSPEEASLFAPENVSMTSAGSFDNDSTSEAVGDAEVSLKMDSPPRQTSVAYVKERDRRASVTVNTQAALDDVANMYGPRTMNSDDSDDNISDIDGEGRHYRAGYTITGMRDSTADVTYWVQPVKSEPDEVDLDLMPISPSKPLDTLSQHQSEFQDENGGLGKRYGQGKLFRNFLFYQIVLPRR